MGHLYQGWKVSVSQKCKDMIDVPFCITETGNPEVLCSITYRDPMAAELIELMFLDSGHVRC